MPPLLRKGDTGSSVSRLQSDLIIHGYPVGQVDGIFGKKTDAAVRQFQSDHDLVVDGIVGPATWGVLEGPVPSVEVTFDVSDFPSLALVFRFGVNEDADGYLTELGISA
ncbi:peptidoglycan-binding protein [Streptomyces sp. NPDC015661]|uniref:peptidoglycan-binding domain-containing protein n=1 Tax=Streptomyces sp. NPDC015661 TaxID=3364961 RepID=UPI0036F5FA2A